MQSSSIFWRLLKKIWCGVVISLGKQLPIISKDEIPRDDVFGFMGKQSPSAGGHSATILSRVFREASFAIGEDFPVFEVVSDRISVRFR